MFLSKLLTRTTSTTLLLASSVRFTSSMTSSSFKVIDSHLHVWANAQEAADSYPYAQDPPSSLQDRASIDSLLTAMNENGIDGALIVQPINHQFDHTYVRSALQQHPDRFKGMLLHDPSLLDTVSAVSRLEELALQGFCGVRFNPYLWPKEENDGTWSTMCSPAGMAVYKRCGELNMPVGIMCFQGLHLHYGDIVKFLQESPTTPLILDHFAFTTIKDDNDKDSSFAQLLSLADYPSVHVKISALFRLGDNDDDEKYARVYEKRFLPLLQAFGKDRLLFGSDFPFCLEQPGAYRMHRIVESWCADDDVKTAILGGTAEKLFGAWGTTTSATTKPASQEQNKRTVS